MTVCAVIDSLTKEQVNAIVAESTDTPPEGCFLVEQLPGCKWNGSEMAPYTPPPPPPDEEIV